METMDAILGRRAIREYENKHVPEELINSILKAGAMAPSAMDTRPCRFIVITNQDAIRKLSDRVKERTSLITGMSERTAKRLQSKEDTIFYGAPLLILVAAEKTKWSPIDCALAAQNMMLRAYDLGLGSCFIGFADVLKDDRETLRNLGVGDSQELYCPLIFGYPKNRPEPKDKEAVVEKRIR
jgi:nitroreductase